MAVSLLEEIRAAEQKAEEIREAAGTEAREIARRAQEALREQERAENEKTREAAAQRRPAGAEAGGAGACFPRCAVHFRKDRRQWQSLK